MVFPSAHDISTCKMLHHSELNSLRTALTLLAVAGLLGPLPGWTCLPRSLKPIRTSPFPKIYHFPILAQFKLLLHTICNCFTSSHHSSPTNCKFLWLRTISTASLEKLLTPLTHNHPISLGPNQRKQTHPFRAPPWHPVLMADVTN